MIKKLTKEINDLKTRKPLDNQTLINWYDKESEKRDFAIECVREIYKEIKTINANLRIVKEVSDINRKLYQ